MEKRIKECIKENGGKELVFDSMRVTNSASNSLSSLFSRDKEKEEKELTNQLFELITKKAPQVTSLTITDCKIFNLDDSIANLTGLETLNVSNNCLSHMPLSLSRLQKLQEVNVNRNRFTNIPIILTQIPLLRLSLCENVVELVDIGTATSGNNNAESPMQNSIQFLDLSSNKIRDLHASFGKLKTLTQLDLEHNALASLPISLCGVASLISLNLGENQIAELPSQISNFTNLTSLLLKRNKLKVLPSEIGKLGSLKTLALNDNELEQLPDSIGQLTGLQILLVQNNALKNLPDQIGSLSSLTMFNLDHNQLENIPDSFSNLTQLSELHLQRNRLETLPQQFGQLTSLQKLFLERNKLKKLPPFTNLQKLTTISLNDNNLSDNESVLQLGQLKQLHRVTLENNPLPADSQNFIDHYGSLAFVQQDQELQDKIKSIEDSIDSKKFRLIKKSVSGSSSPTYDDRKKRSLRKSNIYNSKSRRESVSLEGEVSAPVFTEAAPKAAEASNTTPPYEEWQSAFERLMVDLELTEEKKDQMLKMPTEMKYKLLVQYKKADNLSDANNPSYLSELLRNMKCSKKDLTTIRIQLTSKTNTWVTSFVKENGIPSLLSFIEDLNLKLDKKKNVKENTELLHEALRCLRVLTKSRLSDVLNVTDPTVSSVVVMSIDNPRLKILTECVYILSKVAKIPLVGHTQVMDAITAFLHIKKITYRFNPIVDILHIEMRAMASHVDFDQLEEQILLIPLKSSTLGLINNIINNTEDLEERYCVRSEFIQLGLLKTLADLQSLNNQNIVIESVTFFEGLNDDQEELPLRFEKTKLLQLFGSIGVSRGRRFSTADEEITSLKNSRSSLLPGATGSFIGGANKDTASNIMIVFNYANISAKLSARISYEPDTSVMDIYNKVGKIFGIEASEVIYYVLYKMGTSLTSSGPVSTSTPLDKDKTLADYEMTGEVVVEFHMKPYRSLIQVEHFSLPDIYMEFQPNLHCGEVASQIIKEIQSKIGSGAESFNWDPYGLYFQADNKEHSSWLEDTEKLFKYALHKRKGHLLMKVKPITLRVIFGESISEFFTFDTDSYINEMLHTVCSRLNIASEKIPDYILASQHFGNSGEGSEGGISLKLSGSASLGENANNSYSSFYSWVPMELNKKLAHYKLQQMAVVRLMLRPRTLNITIAGEVLGTEQSRTFTISIEFTQIIEDIMENLAEQHNLPCIEITEDQGVYVVQENGTEKLVDVTLSLRDQRIAYGAKMIWKKKRPDEAAPVVETPKDINIWDEESTQETIRYEDKGNEREVSAATIGRLIEHITTPGSTDDTLSIFLLTYPCFTTLQQIIKKLLERYQVPSYVQQLEAMRIQTKVCDVFEQLKEEFKEQSKLEGFTSQDAIAMLNDITIVSHKIKDGKFKQIDAEKLNKIMSMLDPDHVPYINSITDFRRRTSSRSIVKRNRSGARPAIPVEVKNVLDSLEQAENDNRKTPISKSTSSPPTLSSSTSGMPNPRRSLPVSSEKKGLHHSRSSEEVLKDDEPVSPTMARKSLKPEMLLHQKQKLHKADPMSASLPSMPTPTKEKEPAKDSPQPDLRKGIAKSKVFKIFSKTTDFNDRITFFSIHNREIAEHLTKIGHGFYSKLKPSEFFKQSWNNAKTQHLSPNVIELVNLFNATSNLVSSCIVAEPRVRERAILIVSFINMAEHFRKLNNYHLLIAVITGINNSAVLRLKWTHKKVSNRFKQIQEDLEKLMSMEGSFKTYRAALSQTNPPCVPYIGVSLQDLTFTDENPDKVADNLLNFTKQRIIYNIISDLLRFQGTDYSSNIGESDQIKKFLETLPKLSDKELYNLSLQHEPRNAVRADIK